MKIAFMLLIVTSLIGCMPSGKVMKHIKGETSGMSEMFVGKIEYDLCVSSSDKDVELIDGNCVLKDVDKTE